ncbi:MAG: tRNA pseudouridine(55) synthase TruB [Candidatus Omnitrophota bacterium]
MRILEFITMDGLLLVNKPRGITSYRVVDIIKKRFKVKKVGHAGTLDPQATGLLIILLGSYTKRTAEFIGLHKTYSATLQLGVVTDTADAAGKIIAQSRVLPYNLLYLKNVINSFIGDVSQIPPMYSAKSVRGVRLYKLARRGIVIKRKPIKVKIYDLEIIQINLPDIMFTVRCSTGTYIRTLCEDIGRKIGCGAHLVKLCRTKIANYQLADAIDEGILNQCTHDQLLKYLKNT